MCVAGQYGSRAAYCRHIGYYNVSPTIGYLVYRRTYRLLYVTLGYSRKPGRIMINNIQYSALVDLSYFST